MAGVTGLRFNFNRIEASSLPSIEKMMNATEEFQELQQNRELISILQKRVFDLENMNTNLEKRLEDQAKQSMAMETECFAIERKWKIKCDELLKEIQNSKIAIEREVTKGDLLREHLSRTERELYGLLQRKYAIMRPGNKTSLPSNSTNKNSNLPSDGNLNRNENLWDEDIERISKVFNFFFFTSHPILNFLFLCSIIFSTLITYYVLLFYKNSQRKAKKTEKGE
jgi:hypothetical protein